MSSLLEKLDVSELAEIGIVDIQKKQHAAEQDRVWSEASVDWYRNLATTYSHLMDDQKLLSPHTRRRYDFAWKRFTAYCKEKSFPSLPSRPAFVAAWLDHLVCEGMDKEKSSYAEVKLAAASIARAHKLRGDIDPTADELVTAIVKASRLLDAKLDKKKSKTNGTSH